MIVVGDRVLMQLLEEDRTKTGLLLPKEHLENMQVVKGRIIATGPGIPMGADTDEDEPWKNAPREKPKYFPMQAKAGDTAVFFRRAAVEVRYQDKDYLIVPHGAILLLERQKDTSSDLGEVPDFLA